jgi:hypothetical protein
MMHVSPDMPKKNSRRRRPVNAQALVHLRREVAALHVLLEEMSERLDSVRMTAEANFRRCGELQVELDALKKSRGYALAGPLP